MDDKYDTPFSHMGAYSGYILNVMMSALYIPLLLHMRNSAPFNRLAAAWCKGVGTLFISIFCFLKFEDPFLLSIGAVTTLLDGICLLHFAETTNDISRNSFINIARPMNIVKLLSRIKVSTSQVKPLLDNYPQSVSYLYGCYDFEGTTLRF